MDAVDQLRDMRTRLTLLRTLYIETVVGRYLGDTTVPLHSCHASSVPTQAVNPDPRTCSRTALVHGQGGAKRCLHCESHGVLKGRPAALSPRFLRAPIVIRSLILKASKTASTTLAGFLDLLPDSSREEQRPAMQHQMWVNVMPHSWYHDDKSWIALCEQT